MGNFQTKRLKRSIPVSLDKKEINQSQFMPYRIASIMTKDNKQLKGFPKKLVNILISQLKIIMYQCLQYKRDRQIRHLSA